MRRESGRVKMVESMVGVMDMRGRGNLQCEKRHCQGASKFIRRGVLGSYGMAARVVGL